MIRSHSAWHSSDLKKWAAAQRHYQAHLKEIAPDLPPALARFARNFTLHDNRIVQANVVARGPSLRDALVPISIFRDGCRGAAALQILHLIGLHGNLRPVPSHLDILFFDVEVLSATVFQLSFALDGKRTWKVKFRDFDYYFHDYQASAPAVLGSQFAMRTSRK